MQLNKMSACSFITCNMNSSRAKLLGMKVSFFRYPKNEILKAIWIHKSGRDPKGFNVKKDRVCSLHFSDDVFRRDLRNELLGLPQKLILKPHAIPSSRIFAVSERARRRKLRREKRNAKKYIKTVLNTDHNAEVLRNTSEDDSLTLNYKSYSSALEENMHLKHTLATKENELRNCIEMLKKYKKEVTLLSRQCCSAERRVYKSTTKRIKCSGLKKDKMNKA